MPNLKNKIVIITGASRGIGRACAIELAKAGAKIVVNYHNSKDKADEAVSDIVKVGGHAVAIQADVSKKKDCQKLIDQTVEEYGQIDILVNNAGIMKTPSVDQVDEEAWDKVMDINAKSVYMLSVMAGKVMKQQGKGVIVNISSIAGEYPSVSNWMYCATKGAVSNLTRGLSIALAPEVRVNAVAPGRIETDMTTQVDSDDKHQEIESCNLRKRLGYPEDIARVVSFLASDESDWISGEIIRADGGGIVKMAAVRNKITAPR